MRCPRSWTFHTFGKALPRCCCSPVARARALNLCTSLHSSEPPAPPVADSDTARRAVFGDLSEIRTTVDLLRARLASLEGVLAKAFTAPPAQPPPPHPQFTHPPPHQGPYFDSRNLYSGGPEAGSSSYAGGGGDGDHAAYGREDGNDGLERRESLPRGMNGDGASASGKQAEEELEASVALEFLALGRHRAFGVTSATTEDEDPSAQQQQRLPDPVVQVQDQDPYAYSHLHPSQPAATDPAPTPSFPPSPTQLYPTTASLAASLPSRVQGDAIILHSVDWLGWHSGAIHAPSFKTEVAEFWNWGENRVDVCNPAWLALYFAMLVVGVGNLAAGQAPSLGMSEGAPSSLSCPHGCAACRGRRS
jgi:hypothetical protein